MHTIKLLYTGNVQCVNYYAISYVQVIYVVNIYDIYINSTGCV